jgi:hypothetical protein
MRTLVISLFLFTLALVGSPLQVSAQCQQNQTYVCDDVDSCYCQTGSATGGSTGTSEGTTVIIGGVNTGGGTVTTGTNSGGSLINPLQGGANLQTFLLNLLDFVIRIGAIIVVLMLVYVGYLFVIARGAPGEIEAARKALLWTLVGALILLGSKAIALAIQATVATL